MKYLIVTGGVISGLGKGVTISSIGRIIKSSGIRVTAIKVDPYLNVDAGLMSPFEHGETFVLDDGGETDLDLGNYERFLDITLSSKHNITSGKVYQEVISKERRGDFLGKTVQIVPHVTDAVQTWIENVAKIPVDDSGLEPEVCLVEVGGTIGDIESMVFLEALRQFQFKVGRENILLIHVSLVPCISGEQKTKPTQHSVKELRSLGLFPDLIVCRSPTILNESTKAKLSIFCQVELNHVLSVHDVSNIYHVPLILVQQQIHKIVKEQLNLIHMQDFPSLSKWETIAKTVDNFPCKVDIAIVGKYNGLSDSYLSVLKSLMHSGIYLNVEVDVKWIDAADLEDESKSSCLEKYNSAWNCLKKVAGVVVPGGFGNRGVEGKILAAQYCRESKIPYLGVCLGMQVMVIEYCRNVMGLTDANSTEFNDKASNQVVIFMPEINPNMLGGTMRLGSRSTLLSKSISVCGGVQTLASKIYGFDAEDKVDIVKTESHGSSTNNSTISVDERHRHRYEVNPSLVQDIESKGLYFTGKDDSNTRMEIAELPQSVHPYYIGTQFHPEYKSRPYRPSPPFYGLVAASLGHMNDLDKAGRLWQSEKNGKIVHSVHKLSMDLGSPIGSQVEIAIEDRSPTPYRKRTMSLFNEEQKILTPSKISAMPEKIQKL